MSISRWLVLARILQEECGAMVPASELRTSHGGTDEGRTLYPTAVSLRLFVSWKNTLLLMG